MDPLTAPQMKVTDPSLKKLLEENDPHGLMMFTRSSSGNMSAIIKRRTFVATVRGSNKREMQLAMVKVLRKEYGLDKEEQHNG